MSARSQFLATTSGTESGAAGDYLLNTLKLAVVGTSQGFDAPTAKLVDETMALAKAAGADQRFTAYVAKITPEAPETKTAPAARTTVKMGSGM